MKDNAAPVTQKSADTNSGDLPSLSTASAALIVQGANELNEVHGPNFPRTLAEKLGERSLDVAKNQVGKLTVDQRTEVALAVCSEGDRTTVAAAAAKLTEFRTKVATIALCEVETLSATQAPGEEMKIHWERTAIVKALKHSDNRHTAKEILRAMYGEAADRNLRRLDRAALLLAERLAADQDGTMEHYARRLVAKTEAKTETALRTAELLDRSNVLPPEMQAELRGGIAGVRSSISSIDEVLVPALAQEIQKRFLQRDTKADEAAAVRIAARPNERFTGTAEPRKEPGVSGAADSQELARTSPSHPEVIAEFLRKLLHLQLVDMLRGFSESRAEEKRRHHRKQNEEESSRTESVREALSRLRSSVSSELSPHTASRLRPENFTGLLEVPPCTAQVVEDARTEAAAKLSRN